MRVNSPIGSRPQPTTIFRGFLLAAACALVAPAALAAPQAIQLSNTSDTQGGWVSVSDNASLRLQNFTVEMWIKPLGPGFGHTGDAPGATLFAKPDQGGQGGGPLSYHMGWCPTTQKLDFLLTNTPPSTYVDLVSSSLAPLNAWTHVAFAFDGSQMRILLNGVEDSSAPFPYASVYYGSEPLLIGAGNYLPPYLRRYEGLVDDVRLWNYARSASQVAAQMSCSLSGSEAGLVAYWRLDGDLLDATTNASNGTLVGTATYTGTSAVPTSCATTGVPPPSVPSLISLTSTLDPTRDLVELAFALSAEASVKLAVFDVTGRQVAALLDDVTMAKGPHEVQFQIGSLRKGLYFARLRIGPQSAVCRMLIRR